MMAALASRIADERSRLPTLRLWAGRGFWAVTDQALFSGANFLVNILLARWLPPEEYGAFAVSMSIFYLLAAFHTAVLTEPMMIFGAGKYREQLLRYRRIVLCGHWLVAVLVSGGLGVAALAVTVAGSSPMSRALAGLALASPFLLLLWLMRRSCYLELRPHRAAVASGLTLAGSVATMVFLAETGSLSSLTGLSALGAASGLGSVLLLTWRDLPALGSEQELRASTVLANHWNYARWNILSVSFYWGSGQILMVLVPVFLGLRASAAIAATWTLYRPVSQFVQALGLLVLPTFARMTSRLDGTRSLRRPAMALAALFGSGVAAYAFLASLYAEPLLHLLYGGKYDEYWRLVPLFGVSIVVSTGTGFFILALKASGHVRDASLVWGLSAGLVLVTVTPLMMVAGVEGAVMSAAFAYSAALVASYRRLRQVTIAPEGVRSVARS